VTPEIAKEIQEEQNHGRQNTAMVRTILPTMTEIRILIWANCIADHNARGLYATPRERRQHLIKLAGLAVSAIESFDRKQQ
jgi:hypothetical protein